MGAGELSSPRTEAPPWPPRPQGSEGLSPCVGDSALLLLWEDKLGAMCFTLGKIGYSGKNVKRLRKDSSQYERSPIRKGAYWGHDKNFFLPCEKIVSSKLLTTVYCMGPLSWADKEGGKPHFQ